MSNVLFLDRYRKTGDSQSPLFEQTQVNAERLARIRVSLDRLNHLMEELRKLNSRESL